MCDYWEPSLSSVSLALLRLFMSFYSFPGEELTSFAEINKL